MVGCNVQEDDDSSLYGGSPRSIQGCTPRSYEELSQYGYGCRETLPTTTGTGSNTSGGGGSGETATDSSHPANIARYVEYEPNNVQVFGFDTHEQEYQYTLVIID